MATRSTANFISYDLRPAKQSERRLLLEVLKIGSDCGAPVRSYRYVGMGANRFYDFMLIHKYIGMSNMVSLEHDPVMFARAGFNCPYGFIRLKNLSTADFIAQDDFEVPSVFWLDYDGGLRPAVISDITSLGASARLGDFCFVTTYGGPPGNVEKMNDQQRLDWVKNSLGDAAGDIEIADVQSAQFHSAVHKALFAAFQNAFSFRAEGEFVPLLQVEYSDSKPMVTVGGAFVDSDMAAKMRAAMATVLPFFNANQAELYSIRSFHLTEKERVLFDRASTLQRNKTRERTLLEQFGFVQEDFDAYRDLIRYLPRYVETMV